MLYLSHLKRMRLAILLGRNVNMQDFEKIYKELQKYLDEHVAENMSPEDTQGLVNEFMGQYNASVRESAESKVKSLPKTSDDYLDLAGKASNDQEARKYIKEALRLDPDNIDAEVMLMAYTKMSIFSRKSKLEGIIRHAEQILAKQGFMDKEYEGDFWLVWETRPYMRAKDTYMRLLIRLGMLGKAIEECQDMLRLCKNDNQGVRYTLMHLFAVMEKKEEAFSLFKEFEEESSCMFLLPLAGVCFKCDDIKLAGKYVDMLARSNKDTKLFFRKLSEGAINLDAPVSALGYRVGSIEEYEAALQDYPFFYEQNEAFMEWAHDRIMKK